MPRILVGKRGFTSRFGLEDFCFGLGKGKKAPDVTPCNVAQSPEQGRKAIER